MKALSIRQPYAWAIVAGYKPVENRDWATNFRGRILIHASKREERGDVENVLKLVAWQTNRPLADIETEYAEHLQSGGLGAVVGAATVTDCVDDMENEWFYGRYGFVMADPKAIKPVPCKGALSFFVIPADVATAIRDTSVCSENQEAHHADED